VLPGYAGALLREVAARRGYAGQHLARPDPDRKAVVTDRPIQVLVCDDQALIRTGFATIFGAQADLDVVGEAAAGQAAVDLATRLRPDVVVMDVRMPVPDGIEATRRLAGAGVPNPVKVLVVTTFNLDEYVYEALRAGASGFLLKDAPPDDLIGGVRTVAAGEALLAPEVTRRLVGRFASRIRPAEPSPDAAGALTSREIEVLILIAAGLSNSEIAGTFGDQYGNRRDLRLPPVGQARPARPRPGGRLRLPHRPRRPTRLTSRGVARSGGRPRPGIQAGALVVLGGSACRRHWHGLLDHGVQALTDGAPVADVADFEARKQGVGGLAESGEASRLIGGEAVRRGVDRVEVADDGAYLVGLSTDEADLAGVGVDIHVGVRVGQGCLPGYGGDRFDSCRGQPCAATQNRAAHPPRC
jgi:DNA-binding NarL/FixJ family response regulator